MTTRMMGKTASGITFQKYSFFLVMVAATIALSFYKICNWDVFWHLKTGQVILETGSLVRNNLFSGTYPDHPWSNPEWLFEILLALVFRLGGWNGLVLFKVAVSVLLGSLLYVIMLRENGKPLLASLIVILVMSAIQYRLTERPHLISYVFFALILLLVQRHRRQPDHIIWLLPPIFALWSNIHPELIIGLLYIAVVLVGDILNRIDRGKAAFTPDRRLLFATLLCLPATLLNPETSHVILFPFKHMFIGSVVTVSEYEYSSFLFMPLFFLAVIITFFILILGRDHRDWSDILPLAGLALAGVLHIRSSSYFFLVAGPAVNRLLLKIPRSRSRLVPHRTEIITLAGTLIFFFWALGFDRMLPYQWGWGINHDIYPVAAATTILENNLPPNLFNRYGHGSYLIYRLYPRMGVFQDGRLQAYPREFMARANSQLSLEDWPRLLDDYQINTALIEARNLDVFFSHRDWALVFWDDKWCVLVRRAPEHAEVVNRLEYRLFMPGLDISKVSDPRRLELLVEEMSRNQQERFAASQVLENDKGAVLMLLQRYDEAGQAFRRAVELDPEYAAAWANLALFHQRRGDVEKSRQASSRAIDLDPGLSLPDAR